MPAQGIRD